MRRLAKQSRDDAYKSLRDYQQISSKTSKRLTTTGMSEHLISMSASITASPAHLVAWGGYFAAENPVLLEISLLLSDEKRESWTIEIDRNWRRHGGITQAALSNTLNIEIKWSGPNKIDLWGLSVGVPKLPLTDEKETSIEDFNQPHLSPETYYLDHSTGIGLDIENDITDDLIIEDGRHINLKKCSYCGRLLPIDLGRLGSLSFHKHNAKISQHQNECRACKKWRINNKFNPIRTADQLHESSVITRERKILLREPERLQAIKKRSGEGLRTQIWLKFHKMCFRCSTPVNLNDFQLDHTRPLAYLWPIDEYATCLCASCNNEKKDKFPIDFYNSDELDRLSKITELPLDELKKKDVNKEELDRILENLPKFAKKWDARTFFAINRKVNELKPNINIARLLEAADSTAYGQLLDEYLSRPISTTDI
jgi:hypothetical protein